jgi:hypothetical protein
MPQINEYEPQVGAQGAVGGVTPNLEAVSLFGRGIENLGRSFQEAGDVIHRREAQEETSKIYGQFAQARADWNINLKKRLNDPNFSADQFDQEYADYINKAGENIKTAEGKDFFNRQANRLGGELMTKAVTQTAQIAGEKAFQAISGAVDVHVANLHGNPEDGPHAIDATNELIAQKLKDGTIDRVTAMKLQNQLLPQLAMASVKGYAEIDPGKDDSGKPHENIAKQFLDKGGYKEFLNDAQRTHLYEEARAADNRRRIEGDRLETDAIRQRQKDGQDYMDSNAPLILSGKLSTKAIMQAPGTLQQKEYMLNAIEKINKQESITDKKVYNSTYRSILSGDITSKDQLHAMVLDGLQIAPHDVDYLEKKIDSSPDGMVIKKMQKSFDKMIDKSFNLKGFGEAPMVGAGAAAADTRMELMNTEKAFIDAGGTARAFWTNTDTKDPLSPYAVLQRHQINLPEMLKMQTEEMHSQITGLNNGIEVNRYSNSPTKDLPPEPLPVHGPATPTVEVTPATEAPSIETAPSVFDEHPNDTPEVKANRARNKATFEAAQAALNSLSEATSQTVNNQGLSKGVEQVSKQLHDLFKSPQIKAIEKSPTKLLRRPGESLEAYNKRLGIQ